MLGTEDSPLCDGLICAPGNAGIAQIADCRPVGAEDLDGLVQLAQDEGVGLVVVGPEMPLVAGLVDRLQAAGIAAFGPSARAAELEGSKGFMKGICTRAGVPTADFGRFSDPQSARVFARGRGAPLVVKADGLAAGKGVILCLTGDEARAAIESFMVRRDFGAAGDSVVIEEFLEGEEASLFALVDGTDAVLLASAQDHKAAFDGDRGPNTGGMGAYSPAPVVDAAMAETAMERIVRPVIGAMAERGRPYKGVLYAGLMITEDGAQAAGVQRPLRRPGMPAPGHAPGIGPAEALLACAEGRLKDITLRWRPEAALTVVLAARGYPGAYAAGSEIKGLDEAEAVDGVAVFHAGTKAQGGKILAMGGRVLGVTALGPTIAEAQKTAYKAVDRIDCQAASAAAISAGARLTDRRVFADGLTAHMLTSDHPRPTGDTMDDKTRTELEAAAFRGLVEHLQWRTDAQNIDLMTLAGFCRNCLAKWYVAAAEERGVEVSDAQAREVVYGMPYAEWKQKHQEPASDDQNRRFAETKPMHSRSAGISE